MGAALSRNRVLPAAAFAATAMVAALAATRDEGHDNLLTVLARAAGLPWQAVALALVIPLLAAAHYLFAAVALRAASGTRRTLGEVAHVQLAAAAANRVVPGGFGAFAVNLRYLVKSGVHPGAALSSVGVLGVVGGATDAAFTAGVLTLGPLLGLSGGAHELGLLARRGVAAGSHLPWPVTAVGGALLVAAVVWHVRRSGGRPHELGRDLGRHLARLAVRPRRLATMTLASGATTVVLAIGFAATVVLVGGPHLGLPLGALVTIYLVAAAIGGATPLPAMFGVTEAALVAALVVAGVPFHVALISTLVFRLIAFWMPLPLGVLAARRLRTRALL